MNMKIYEDGQEREATTAEIEQAKIDAELSIATKKAEKDESDRKAAAKAALLERLGITADEAALLLS